MVYDNVPDSVLSSVLMMDANLARLVQTECEKDGLFKNISFLEARQKLIEYDLELEDEDDTDEILADEYIGRRTNFSGRLKDEIKTYISQFSEAERRILMNASDKDNPAGSLAITSIMLACGYIKVVEKPVEEKPSRLSSLLRRFYARR